MAADKELDPRGSVLHALLPMKGSSYGEAVARLDKDGFKVVNAKSCVFEGKRSVANPPTEIAVTVMLNLVLAGGTIRPDPDKCARQITTFGFLEKIRFLRPEDVRASTKFDTAGEMKGFEEAFGGAPRCNRSKVLTRCEWLRDGSPAERLWIEVMTWPGGYRRGGHLVQTGQ